jgi:hypothetical protein
MGCNSTVPVKNFDNQIITQFGDSTSTVKSVQKSIVRAAVTLGWKTKVTSDNAIVATLDIRKHQLVVLITHDDKSFSIEYRDSTNLKYNGTKIHRQYINWVTNLIRSIHAQNIT